MLADGEPRDRVCVREREREREIEDGASARDFLLPNTTMAVSLVKVACLT